MNIVLRYPKVSLVVLIMIWGMGYPIMKVGLAYCPPLIFAGLRAMTGGLVLAGLALRSGEALNFRDTWRAMLASLVFNVLLFFGTSAIAIKFLPSGIASVLLYAQPIMVGLLAHFLLNEALTQRKFTGLLIGFIGVAIISYKGFTGDLSLYGVAMGLLSALGWAIGTVFIKRKSPRSIYWFIALPFLAGGLSLCFIGFALGERPSEIVWNMPFIITLLWGSVIGLATSWVIWFNLVKTGDASTLSANTFLVPVVSMIGGALLLGESAPLSLYAGGVLVIYSIYLVNRPAPRKMITSK
ncbi:MAG TPA: DMT family transporter [Rugosibacter sp.]